MWVRVCVQACMRACVCVLPAGRASLSCRREAHSVAEGPPRGARGPLRPTQPLPLQEHVRLQLPATGGADLQLHHRGPLGQHVRVTQTRVGLTLVTLTASDS